MSVVECPSHVTRSPDAAGDDSRAAGSTRGNAQTGARISSPSKNSLRAHTHRLGAMRWVGSGFSKRPATNSGERRRRSASGFPPNAAK